MRLKTFDLELVIFRLQLSYTFSESEAIVGYHRENMFETRVPTWELPQLQRPTENSVTWWAFHEWSDKIYLLDNKSTHIE